MKDMTEEEYNDLDEYYTKNTIMPDFSKPGFFAHKYGKNFIPSNFPMQDKFINIVH